MISQTAVDTNSESSFLHELCNALTIAQSGMFLLSKNLKRSPEMYSVSEVLEKIDKSLESIDRLNQLVNSRRLNLKTDETRQ